ncbi:hypothetical protein AGMMS49992_07830 [Clostridia bacterium]|nr:hypothetical protein AGMMS49992_07830 [Clostridia bacterium]
MRKFLLSIMLAVVMLTAAGCWNSLEMSQLSIVMGLGVDSSPDGDYLVTAQIARPALLKSPGDSGEAYFNVTQSGQAVFSALRDLMSMFSRKMYTQQCEVLVISEDVARMDVAPILEYFMRNVESRMTMPLMIARGQAYDVFSQTTYLESMPAIQLAKMAQNQRFTGRTSNKTVFSFISDLTSMSRQPTAPIVELFTDELGKTKARVAGTAVFNGSRMVGSFDEDEVYGLLVINNEMHTGVMQITGLGGLIELEINRADTVVKPIVEGSSVSMRLTVNLECVLISTTSRENINDVDKILEIERLAREEILNRVTSALDAAQTLKSDVFGFGQRVYQQHPKVFEAIQRDQGGWENVFPTLQVDADVSVNVTSMGATLQPIKEGGADE